MNITPIEIRQKEFERQLRGYDKDEVNAFLHTLSQAWERVLQENRDKTTRLEKAEEDIKKVREVESSLFRTLKTAEDTSSEIVSKAQRTAEERIQEAERRSQEVVDEAHARAHTIVEQAKQEAESVVYGLHERVDQLKHEAEEAESRRQYALAQLQELADRMLQQVANAQPSSAEEAIATSQRQLDDLQNTVSQPETATAEPLPSETDSVSEDEPVSEERSPDRADHEDESAYEPVWAAEESEDAPTEEPIAARLKRGSFFDDLE